MFISECTGARGAYSQYLRKRCEHLPEGPCLHHQSPYAPTQEQPIYQQACLRDWLDSLRRMSSSLHYTRTVNNVVVYRIQALRVCLPYAFCVIKPFSARATRIFCVAVLGTAPLRFAAISTAPKGRFIWVRSQILLFNYAGVVVPSSDILGLRLPLYT